MDTDLTKINEIADKKMNKLLDASKEYKEEQLKKIEANQEKVQKHWGDELALLKTYIDACYSIGVEHFKVNKDRAEKENNNVFLVFGLLHRRVCSIAYEVHCLLSGGFADGAMGRYRTLYEIQVIANYIYKNGNDCALRYLEHGVCESYKFMTEYQANCSRLGQSPYTQEEMNIALEEKQELVRKYGNSYGKDYGWARLSRKTTFRELEEESGQSYMRPYYIRACNYIHGGVNGSINSLASITTDSTNTIIDSPSINGLAEPVTTVVLDLYKFMAAYIQMYSDGNLDAILNVISLGKLQEVIAEKFIEAQSKINNNKTLYNGIINKVEVRVKTSTDNT